MRKKKAPNGLTEKEKQYILDHYETTPIVHMASHLHRDGKRVRLFMDEQNLPRLIINRTKPPREVKEGMFDADAVRGEVSWIM